MNITSGPTVLQQRDALLAAAEAVAPFLQHTDDVPFVPGVYVPPAAALRGRADEIDRKDAAILALRAAIAQVRGTADAIPRYHDSRGES